mmetsp:Transcript_1398/g.1843  ORF Transcript_1398/g.1843 Transcript_1398/m.1843 type:complete len:308 (+) Transcript_1398:25-948(+)
MAGWDNWFWDLVGFGSRVLNHPQSPLGEEGKEEGKKEEREEKKREKIPPEELARILNKEIMGLFGKHIGEDGRNVDYESMRNDKQFLNYCRITELLVGVDLSCLGYQEMLCFLLNLYNALVVHGLLSVGSPDSSFTRFKFFRTTSYEIGNSIFSLDDLEHGLLRHNRTHPFLKTKQFGIEDPRLQFLLPLQEKFDFRIHFALVCGAKSCPPIRVFSPQNLERGLTCASKNFVQNNVMANLKENTFYLSKIFDWFSTDFGNSFDELIDGISEYMSDEQKQNVQKLMNTKDYKVCYMPYNWNLNGTINE